jgi:hypothetical protein
MQIHPRHRVESVFPQLWREPPAGAWIRKLQLGCWTFRPELSNRLRLWLSLRTAKMDRPGGLSYSACTAFRCDFAHTSLERHTSREQSKSLRKKGGQTSDSSKGKLAIFRGSSANW